MGKWVLMALDFQEFLYCRLAFIQVASLFKLGTDLRLLIVLETLENEVSFQNDVDPVLA